MQEIRAVAVFCGAHPGNDPAFLAAAAALGRGLAEARITVVFGGGRVGLMGALADAAVAVGGTVIGVIPEFLMQREVAHESVTELAITDSMHARKQRMFELADVFVSLPGGLGTMDETVEIITWRQLGLHDKPILLCDIGGSAAPLLAAIDTAIERGFAPASSRGLFEVMRGVPATLRRLRGLRTPPRGEAARL